MVTKKIGLDAGHGLHTAGKQTPTGIKEWYLNDIICDKITAILKDYNCEIIRTDHNEGNVDEPLAQRVNEYIAAGVMCFISIHHNAFTSTWNKATGVEVYTDRKYTKEDDVLAHTVHDKLVKYVKLKDRGIKRANYQVINQNKIPAVLVEGGFMDSTIDYEIITSDAGQTAYAKAIAEALIEFCKLEKKVVPVSKPVVNPDIQATYQVYDHVKTKWLPNVSGSKDFAGNFGNAIDCVLINLNIGDVYYAVHVKGSTLRRARWLPEVKNRQDYAGNKGQPIDAVAIRTTTGKRIKYAVHIKNGKWLPAVTGCNINDSKNGYAGILGKEIDGIRIEIK